MSIVTLFCKTDDFFLAYEAHLALRSLEDGKPTETRGRPRSLHPSEVITILIAFHQSGYRTFKHFYEKHVCIYWRAEFPNLVSYSRFVQLKKEVLALLTLYLHAHLGECSGISFVDSTRLRVCDNKRISSHRVFAEHAGRSKTSMGWFYGFKLHLLINEKGDLLGFELTPGNTDDRQPLWELSGDRFFGTLYGDKGYISKDLREILNARGINLCYKVRRNMKPLDLSVSEEVLLKKRSIIESVIKELKTQTVLEHSRHRSFVNFQVNIVSALIAYQFLENKPSVHLCELPGNSDLPATF